MISSFYERIVGGSPPPEVSKPKILCVGLTCLDIVQMVKSFPVEDSDMRCLDYRWQCGGNAANNCTVLSLLGSPCEFFGTLGTDYQSTYLQNQMRKYGFDFSHCPRIEEDQVCPVSSVILSVANGSRTIVHYNPNFPELTLEDFEKLDLNDYSWIHFEGRNIPRVLSMMQCIESHNDCQQEDNSEKSPIIISVELEKPNSDLLDLLPYADVAFISKEFAGSRGYRNMSDSIRNIGMEIKSGATIICPWGDRGAMARTPDGLIVQSPAFGPPRVIDTLGAGDTFVAATIHKLNSAKIASEKKTENTEVTQDQQENSQPPERQITRNENIESLQCSKTLFIDESTLVTAITFACKVAGGKTGFQGFDKISFYK